MATGEEARSLEHTPTWIVAVVCFVIVLISIIAERCLHKLGKRFLRKHQDALFDALQQLKEELMLLGFISLLLTVFQGPVGKICITENLASYMLPCKMETNSTAVVTHHIFNNGRRLLADDTSTAHCASKGKVPFLSQEALHQLHIFIFVLAVVHVFFCVTTTILGLAKIQQWRHWEHSIRYDHISRPHKANATDDFHLEKFKERAAGSYWTKTTIISWIVSFFKQFYGSVTKSDYIALRSGFISTHIPSKPHFDFHKYMMRTMEHDFKKIVGISWYLWLFVVIFLLMNIQGWRSYFWLSFLPLILLLIVGAKLEHIIGVMALEVAQRETGDPEAVPVKPSDELFWFHRPAIVLNLLHFILFSNSLICAFFFWVLVTYGFNSCIMGPLVYIIPRLVIGIIVQVLCSYSTLPLYALVTQMGSMFKQGIFDEYTRGLILDWAKVGKRRTMERQDYESFESISYPEGETPMVAQGTTPSVVELT